MPDPKKCVPGECEDPTYPDPVKPKPMPANGGGGHLFVTSLPLPEEASVGAEYVLMDDLTDPSSYKGTYILNPDTNSFIASSSGGGSGGVVDTAMSDTSPNAVQNKVIKKYVDDTKSDVVSLLEKKVFVAEYNVTTAAEIRAYLDSAEEPFAPILVKRGNDYYTGILATKSGNNAAIIRVIGSGSGEFFLFTYTVTNATWVNSSYGLQKKLESGTNIKTINNQSLLGEGNIDISGGEGDVYQYSIDSTNPAFQPVSGQTDTYVMDIPDADWDAIWAAKNAGKVVVVRVKKLYDQVKGDDGLVVPMVFGDPTTNPYGSGFGYYMEEPGGLSENRLVVVTMQKTSVAKVYLQYFTVGGGSSKDELFYITVDANAFNPSASDPNVLEMELSSPYTMAELNAILAKTNPESIILRIITTNGTTKDINDIMLNTMSPTGFEGDLFLTTIYHGVTHNYAKFFITPENGKTMLRMHQGNFSAGSGGTIDVVPGDDKVTVNDPDGINSATLQVGGAGVLMDISGSQVAELADKTYVDRVASGAFVLDTANPCSYNELQNAINTPKVIFVKHEGNVYPFVEKWESDEGTKRYVNIASLQRQGADKGAMYFFFEATIGDFDSPMVYSSNFTQPTGKPYTDSVAGNLANLTTTEKTNLVGAVNEVNGKIGVNFAVGKETWYGTYTDENNVTYQVYTKTIYIPALPSTAGITTYPIGVSNMKQIIDIFGTTTDGFKLNAPRQTVSDNITIYQVSKGSQTFSIEVGKDRSSKSAYVTIIYAKNNN